MSCEGVAHQVAQDSRQFQFCGLATTPRLRKKVHVEATPTLLRLGLKVTSVPSLHSLLTRTVLGPTYLQGGQEMKESTGDIGEHSYLSNIPQHG